MIRMPVTFAIVGALMAANMSASTRMPSAERTSLSAAFGSTTARVRLQARAGRRGTPPQPQQKQGLDYFVGSWRFAWTGRESPVTRGPRSGTLAFSRGTGANILTMRTDGQVEEGAAYKESGTIEWDEANKRLTFKEQLSGGAQLTGVGDWSSPLAIRYEGTPLRVQGQTILLRRSYAVISSESFIVTEELSIDGGPFVRLGTGTFTRSPQR